MYAELDIEDLILRDHLAVDRTALANERTFLAYLRTALCMAVAGVSLHHFFPSTVLGYLGQTIGVFSIFLIVLGYRRYRKMRRRVGVLRRRKRAGKIDIEKAAEESSYII